MYVKEFFMVRMSVKLLKIRYMSLVEIYTC